MNEKIKEQLLEKTSEEFIKFLEDEKIFDDPDIKLHKLHFYMSKALLGREDYYVFWFDQECCWFNWRDLNKKWIAHLAKKRNVHKPPFMVGYGEGDMPEYDEQPNILPIAKGKTVSEIRKMTPVSTFLTEYFPDAFRALAQHSYICNEIHNPGEPMHWDREKSDDHTNCALRHHMDSKRISSESGLPEVIAEAWRALAKAQLTLEEMGYVWENMSYQKSVDQ